jgi:hypothetical protein
MKALEARAGQNYVWQQAEGCAFRHLAATHLSLFAGVLLACCRCVLAHCCPVAAARSRRPASAAAGAHAAACAAAGQLWRRAAGAVILTDASRACAAQTAHQGEGLHWLLLF